MESKKTVVFGIYGSVFVADQAHLPDFLYHDEWESLHHLIGPAFLYQP
jgi:hypothetical protein